MNTIKSLFSLLNPCIKTGHFQMSENTESGTQNHEFVYFDAKDVCISSIPAAKIIAHKMGKKVFPCLEKLSESTKNKDRLAKISQTKAWVYKKAVWHPALVEKCTRTLLKKMRMNGYLKNFPLTYKEIYTDTSIIAILHDVGRLSEVDVAQGDVCMERGGLKKHHALISYDILKYAKIKPDILLAIKYHEFAGVKEVCKDDLFKKLPIERQRIAEFYTYILQDMDKTANLTERSIYGITKCAEFFDPHYLQDYGLTEEYFLKAIKGDYLRLKGGHLLDAMMRFVTWTYCIHFAETKEILSKVLIDFFGQMYQEAWREYKNSSDKNAHRLADTLEKITKLEDYAISEKMGMNINTKKRQGILQAIKKLKN